MTNESDRAVLARMLKVDDIKDGARGEIAATEAEMQAIVRMLDLVALERLTLAYRFDRIDGGRLRLTGRLGAKVTQTCVVSLEPIETALDLPLEVEFWPSALVDEFERGAAEAGDLAVLDWPERVVDGK
jgi:hypothetical protein